MKRFSMIVVILFSMAWSVGFSPPAHAATPTVTIAGDSTAPSFVPADSFPRFDSTAVEWQIAPLGTTAGDMLSDYSTAEEIIWRARDTVGTQLMTFQVHRKYSDLLPVYRLVGTDEAGQRHDVSVPYDIWLLAPANKSIRLPVIRIHPQR